MKPNYPYHEIDYVIKMLEKDMKKNPGIVEDRMLLYSAFTNMKLLQDALSRLSDLVQNYDD